MGMNLLDHFSLPVESFVGWPGIHAQLSGVVAERLNGELVLPWRAEASLHNRFEIDVAGVYRTLPDPWIADTVPASWEPPPADAVVPLNPANVAIEVEVFESRGGRRLVGAIEFVSPANKKESAERAAFAAKCEALLAKGVGVIVVDLVTVSRRSLHAALMHRTGVAAPADDALYAAAYHPLDRDGALTADLWYRPLRVGGPLPTLPLFLQGGPCLEVNLQAAYDTTLDRLNLPRDLAAAGFDLFPAPDPAAESAATSIDPTPTAQTAPA